MRARRTHFTEKVFRLRGGTEDNDLYVHEYGPEDGGPAQGSTWEPTPDERAAIAAGANVELLVFGKQHPAVAMRTTVVPLGKPPRPEAGT